MPTTFKFPASPSLSSITDAFPKGADKPVAPTREILISNPSLYCASVEQGGEVLGVRLTAQTRRRDPALQNQLATAKQALDGSGGVLDEGRRHIPVQGTVHVVALLSMRRLRRGCVSGRQHVDFLNG